MLTSIKIMAAAVLFSALACWVESTYHVSDLFPRQVNLGIIAMAADIAFFLLCAAISIPATSHHVPLPNEKPMRASAIIPLLLLASIIGGVATTTLLYLVPGGSFPSMDPMQRPELFTSPEEEYFTFMTPWVGIFSAAFMLMWLEYHEPKKLRSKLRLIQHNEIRLC